jgi:hypothetical protein
MTKRHIRGVHREQVGRGIEPRNGLIGGADAVKRAEGNRSLLYGLGETPPPGSKARACLHRGRPGTWETLQPPRKR